jgi:hypothetical protein
LTVRDINGRKITVIPKFGCSITATQLVNITDENLGPLLREPSGGCFPDSSRTAGDQRNFIFESHSISPSKFSGAKVTQVAVLGEDTSSSDALIKFLYWQ